ncbi:serine hydrolase [Streptomyces physcomitrii]|uniref:serine hydrolase n=1 Tax=Streptomyces physcomitrii TaxID=2724184 RepID=UPI0033F29217
MPRPLSRCARTLAGTVAAGVLLPLTALAAAPASAAEPKRAPGTVSERPADKPGKAAAQVRCASGDSALAARLERDLATALRERAGTVALGLHDRSTGTSCTLRAAEAFDSASIVKVTVFAALLWDAEREGRALTKTEEARAEASITRSDNKATSALWKQLGPKKVRAFLAAAGMHETVPGPDRFWGLTQVTAGDEQRLLDLVTRENGVLGKDSRDRLLAEMAAVVPDQRWGTPAGAPATELAHLKNGWLERDQDGWRVHSLGAFQGAGRDYTMTVLTRGNKTFAYGVDTVERLARAAHRDLGNHTAPARALPVLRGVEPPPLLAA